MRSTFKVLQAAQAEARAEAVLRSWLSGEQVRQLDAHGAFKVYSWYAGAERVLALVRGTNMVYYPAGSMAYGWFPESPLPASEVLLCQALALTPPGAQEMMFNACQWPRGVNPSPWTAYSGPAWTAVDRLMGQLTLW